MDTSWHSSGVDIILPNLDTKYILSVIFKCANYLFFPRTISFSYVSGLSRAGMWCAVCGRCPQWAQPPASPRSPHPPFLILLLVRHWRRGAEQALTQRFTSALHDCVNMWMMSFIHNPSTQLSVSIHWLAISWQLEIKLTCQKRIKFFCCQFWEVHPQRQLLHLKESWLEHCITL